MSQYQPCVPDKFDVTIYLFYNFNAKLWKRNHATMNNPQLTFFEKLTQPWCKVVISKSRKRF